MILFHKESKSKTKKNWGGGGERRVGLGEGRRGRGRWMDRRTGPNQFALQLLRTWGHNNALMFKLCP